MVKSIGAVPVAVSNCNVMPTMLWGVEKDTSIYGLERNIPAPLETALLIYPVS